MRWNSTKTRSGGAARSLEIAAGRLGRHQAEIARDLRLLGRYEESAQLLTQAIAAIKPLFDNPEHREVIRLRMDYAMTLAGWVASTTQEQKQNCAWLSTSDVSGARTTTR